MIISRFDKDDQIQSVALTKNILEAVRAFNDEKDAQAEDPVQMTIPMIANCDGKTPLQLVNELSNKALSDTMVDYLEFKDLIQNQEDVSKLLK